MRKGKKAGRKGEGEDKEGEIAKETIVRNIKKG